MMSNNDIFDQNNILGFLSGVTGVRLIVQKKPPQHLYLFALWKIKQGKIH